MKITLSILVFAASILSHTFDDPSLEETFDNCIRLALVDPAGRIGATDAQSACSAVKDTRNYQQCMCLRYTSIIDCYTSSCDEDPSIEKYKQFRSKYCVELPPSKSNVVVTSYAHTATWSTSALKTNVANPGNNPMVNIFAAAMAIAVNFL